jgi:hypothetical protein
MRSSSDDYLRSTYRALRDSSWRPTVTPAPRPADRSHTNKILAVAFSGQRLHRAFLELARTVDEVKNEPGYSCNMRIS